MHNCLVLKMTAFISPLSRGLFGVTRKESTTAVHSLLFLLSQAVFFAPFIASIGQLFGRILVIMKPSFFSTHNFYPLFVHG